MVLTLRALSGVESYQGWGWGLGFARFLLVGGAIFSGNSVLAQITPDASLGTQGSVVTPNAKVRGLPAELIEGGALRGANLFHSFLEFNVGNGQRVYFANPAGIENILSRVTGNNLSNILGTLGVDGGANLFLLNPNGIIFGSNARLDVAGSFVASTANSLVFENGSQFSATNPNAPPLLSIKITPGLQYGMNQPKATIANAGYLAVGQNLMLAGGNLDLQGQLQAGGNLTLQAQDTVKVRDRISNPFIASAGGQLLVQGNHSVDMFALNHPASIFSSGGNMVWRSANTVGADARVTAGGNFRVEQLDGNLGNLSSPHDPVFEVAGDFSLANYTGASLQILAGGSVNIPGDVRINGFGGAFNDSSVTLSDGTTLALSGTTRPTLDIRAGTTRFFGTPTPGTPTSADISIGSITLNAPDGVVFLTNQYAPNTLLAGGAIALGEVRTDDGFGGFVGNSGSVIIDSRRGITVTNQINSSSASGNTGNITLIANDAISLVNSFIRSYSLGLGKGGDININTGQLLLSDGSQVSTSTYGSGQGGNLTVNASSLVQLIGTSADGRFSTALLAIAEGGSTGKAGDLTINTPVLLLSDGAQVGASTFGSGNGGNVIVNASSLVQIVGAAANSRFLSAIYALTEGGGTGNGGDLTINTPVLLLADGGHVAASTFSPGNSGNVTINASSLVQLTGVSARDRLPSAILAQADRNSTGNGGELRITTGRLIVRDGGQVSAATFETGSGGILDVRASDSIEVSGTSADGQFTSGLYSDSRSAGNARDIRINTGRLVVENGGKVSASGTGTGLSGNLDVTADSILLSNKGSLRATTNAGEGGNIRLKIADSLTLRNNSEIVATATGTANGGNINIEAGSFILGVLKEDSDIVADASQGRGGTISAKAPGIFGFRQFIDRRTPESDFTASSAFGVDGSVEIDTQDRLEAPLPTDFVDATELIDRRCTADAGTQKSSFTVTGRGGLPPNPNEPLIGEAVITNWATLDSEEEKRDRSTTNTNSTSTKPKKLVEAQGWIIDANGQVILTAQANTVTSETHGLKYPSCQDVQAATN